jgi:hypothetical protein
VGFALAGGARLTDSVNSAANGRYDGVPKPHDLRHPSNIISPTIQIRSVLGDFLGLSNDQRHRFGWCGFELRNDKLYKE